MIFASLGVFGIAIVAGYFLLPSLFSKELIKSYLTDTTDSESDWRDHWLKPLTDLFSRRWHFITPNIVTAIGFILIVYLIYLFHEGANIALIFFVAMIAGLTDAFDGPLARNSGRVTKLGAIMDASRDFALVLVLSFYLISYHFLADYLFFWFLIGYAFLGVIRNFEFKLAFGKISPEKDYKFVLDRVRLVAYIVGILLLFFIPLAPDFRTLGETLIISSIVITWISVLFHSAHLKILRDEKAVSSSL